VAGWAGRHRMVQQPGMVPIGFSLLSAVDSSGVITGFCFAAASTADQQMAESFFAMRARPNERLISVGSAASGPYIAYSRASKAPKTTDDGSNVTEQMSSTHPNGWREDQRGEGYHQR
jgi:hypothetical protein